jgi:hypothetical protein
MSKFGTFRNGSLLRNFVPGWSLYARGNGGTVKPSRMLLFGMRLIRILPLLAFLPPALADVGDFYIPQCDRAYDRCIKWSFTSSGTQQCRKSREACRTTTLNEAIRNSGMSASKFLDSDSLRGK